MPVKIHSDLPAYDLLREENVSVIPRETRMADMQRITEMPELNFLLLNLMPNKIITETQILRLLAGTSFQVEVDLLFPDSYEPENVEQEHLERFYSSFSEVKHKNYDGMIVTGAPIETLPFEEVDYWQEFIEIIDWSFQNVISTLFICWGAFAAFYHHYGLEKQVLEEKLFGVYPHEVRGPGRDIVRGFSGEVMAPHSRYARVDEEEIKAQKELEILLHSEKAGAHLTARHDRRQIFQTGHFEYDAGTLKQEFERDRRKKIDIDIPENYFPEDDPGREPQMTWRKPGQQFYRNWLYHYIYIQKTPSKHAGNVFAVKK